MNRKNILHTIQSIPLKLRLYRVLRLLLAWFLFASLVNLLLSYMFYTHKSYRINRENKAIVKKLEDLNSKVEKINLSLEDIHFRDKNVYRALFGLPDVISFDRSNSYADEKYSAIANDRYHELLVSTWKNLDGLSQNLVRSSMLLDTVNYLAHSKDLMLRTIPIIMPIDKKGLKYISDRYGYRIHPIFKIRIFHEGIDLACNKNTPVYATGDGIVVSMRNEPAGYGKFLVVDHGFGYLTKYAHLNSFQVEVGREVKRGEQIALSGSTGRSSGPHVHYEVIYNNKPVNPANYFSQSMSDQEFSKILEEAKGASLDNYSKIFMNGNTKGGVYGN